MDIKEITIEISISTPIGDIVSSHKVCTKGLIKDDDYDETLIKDIIKEQISSFYEYIDEHDFYEGKAKMKVIKK